MSTQSFEVAFRFDGRLADQGVLDGSDHETATRASRRLLALHAHCFLHGSVPAAALSDGKGYSVRHVATQKGSHYDIWNVVFNNTWTVQIVGGLIAAAYAEEAKAGLNFAAIFLRDSVKAVLGTGSKHLPEFRAVEPVFEARDTNHQPVIDIDFEQQSVRSKLREVTFQVLHDLARPVGRSADRLDIIINGELIAVIDEKMKRQWVTDQISIAVTKLKHGPRALTDLSY